MSDKAAYDYADKMMQDYKTDCCKAKPYRKGRANIRCSKCDKDVTLEMVLLSEFFVREFEEKTTLK